MKRTITILIALFAITFINNVISSDGQLTTTACSASAHAPNDGTYSKTSSSVSVYTDSGAYKGSFPVYLHHGKRYIDFHNTWICIQGKSRFGYCGNWYVIK